MIDLSGLDMVAIGSGVGAIIKALMSDSKAEKANARASEIETARIATKAERDREFQEIKTEVAVLKAQNEMMQKQLAEGTTRFCTMENDLKQINKSLNVIIGKLSEMRRSGHAPEEGPV